ncbi:MAG: hypothetical protein KTR25_15120 [Myxococcales bacterium]|nr:hypothetical protein [Myxococcales bacterium]
MNHSDEKKTSQTGAGTESSAEVGKLNKQLLGLLGSKPKLASIILVLGLFGGVQLFSGNRRIEVQFAVQVAQPQCSTHVELSMGEHHRLKQRSHRILPPWKVYIRPGEYHLEGTLQCLSGADVSVDGLDLLLHHDQLVSVTISSRCSC